MFSKKPILLPLATVLAFAQYDMAAAAPDLPMGEIEPISAHVGELAYEPEHSYPSMQVMNSIYKELLAQGVIRAGEGPLSSNATGEELVVDERLLRNVYDWALDNEYLDSSHASYIAQDIEPGNFDYFNAASKDVLACTAATFACAGEGYASAQAVGALPCLAAGAEAGVNPVADAWCLATIGGIFGGAIVACMETIKESDCASEPDTSVFIPGSTGSNKGAHKNGQCGANGIVQRVRVWQRDGRITKIQGFCSDETSFYAGSGNGSSADLNCGNGHLASGIRGRSGSQIDSFGLHCDDVGEYNNKFDSTHLVGGSGGGSYSLKCPYGEGYLYGINARETWHYRAKKRKLNWIQPLCRY